MNEAANKERKDKNKGGKDKNKNDIQKDNDNNIDTNIDNNIDSNINNNINNNIDNNINNDIDTNIDKDIDTDMDQNINKERKPRKYPKNSTKAAVTVSNNQKLEGILAGETEKKKVPQYLHLKPEIVEVLDKYAGKNKKGRGSQKSELVNLILEDFFKQRGDL